MKTNTINKPNCIVCNSTDLVLEYNLKYGDVLFCQQCQLANVKFNDINDFYKANSKWAEPQRLKNQIYYLSELRRIALNRLKLLLKYSKRTNLLEFGPNTGEFLYVASKHGFKTAAVDKYPAILNLNNPKELILFKSDASEVSLLNKFDNMVAFHLLEHLELPEVFISKVKQSLNPKGILFLEVPNYNSFSREVLGKNWYMFYDYHITHFNVFSIKKMLVKNGFKIVYWQTIQPSALYLAQFYLPFRHFVWNKIKSLFPVSNNNRTFSKSESQSLSKDEELAIFDSIKTKIIRVENILIRFASLILYPISFVVSKMGKGDIIQIIAEKES